MDVSKLTKEERRALINATLARDRKTQGRSYNDHQISGAEMMLALFGLPAESNPRSMVHYPILTFLLIGITSFISFMCFQNEDYFRALAFFPEEPFRAGGLTLLTCFFVHGGLFHLLSNMYCLFVFGDNVEDVIGMMRYALLLTLATLAGSVLSLLGTDPAAANIPHVGASGGIFGVMVFYLLRFPKSRFTYMFFFQFIRVPAIVVLGLYAFLQITGTFQQLAGEGNVDYLAHLGGGAMGFLFWLMTGRNSADGRESDDWV